MKKRFVLVFCVIGLAAGFLAAREYDDMPDVVPAAISPIQEFDRHLILVAEFDVVIDDPEEILRFFAEKNVDIRELARGGWNRAELEIVRTVCRVCRGDLCCLLYSLAKGQLEPGITVAVTMDELFWTVATRAV